MYKLTCIKCGKTISINLADPNYINKMTKLIKLLKPEKIDDIIRSGVVLKSRKAYKEISKFELTSICAIRAHDDRSSCVYYKPCADISKCKLCFLNANNYLNVLKYIKHNKDKFPYVYRGIESIY
jgi:hypothetical protein